MDVNPIELAFDWSQMSFNCPSLQYIVTFNCGLCPTITFNTTIICTGVQISADSCIFTIQTNVCNSITGNVTSILLTLKGYIIMYIQDICNNYCFGTVPEAPTINVIPSYSHSTRNLSSLAVVLYEVVRFCDALY